MAELLEPEEIRAAQEKTIVSLMARTGKTREQAEACLTLLGSAFRRRGWSKGEPLSEDVRKQLFGKFIGQRKPEEGQ